MPTEHSDPTGDEGGPVIVVGYDGSSAAAAAVERGIDRVQAGGRLVVVHAWRPPAVLLGSELYVMVATACCAAAEGLLERLAREHPRLDDVQFESRLIEGTAYTTLAEVAAAEHANEVIVGTRGAGRLHAMLGGTAIGLLHHAECPVTFIPQRTVDQGGTSLKHDERAAGPVEP